jgi:hypothetical protein
MVMMKERKGSLLEVKTIKLVLGGKVDYSLDECSPVLGIADVGREPPAAGPSTD